MSTIINARSPYYIKVEPATGTLSSASMELFIYAGTFLQQTSLLQQPIQYLKT